MSIESSHMKAFAWSKFNWKILQRNYNPSDRTNQHARFYIYFTCKWQIKIIITINKSVNTVWHTERERESVAVPINFHNLCELNTISSVIFMQRYFSEHPNEMCERVCFCTHWPIFLSFFRRAFCSVFHNFVLDLCALH